MKECAFAQSKLLVNGSLLDVGILGLYPVATFYVLPTFSVNITLSVFSYFL